VSALNFGVYLVEAGVKEIVQSLYWKGSGACVHVDELAQAICSQSEVYQLAYIAPASARKNAFPFC
jgi:hypothetical protein